MAGKLKFPHPSKVSDAHGSCSRSAEEIIKLVNAREGTNYKNLAPGAKDLVRSWAKEEGWAAVLFPLEIPKPSAFGTVVFVKQSELDKATAKKKKSPKS